MKDREAYVAEVYRRYHAYKAKQKRRRGYLIVCVTVILCSVVAVTRFYPIGQPGSVDSSVSSREQPASLAGQLTVQITDASGRSSSTQDTAIADYLGRLTAASVPGESQPQKGNISQEMPDRPQYIITVTDDGRVQTYHVQDGVLTVQESGREIPLTRSQQEQLAALIGQLQP